jgi:hypothetical protein
MNSSYLWKEQKNPLAKNTARRYKLAPHFNSTKMKKSLVRCMFSGLRGIAS